MAAVGVLGGTFDPPHLGHRAVAEGGIAQFGLTRLLVRVVADPGHKEVETPADVRLELASLAFGDLPGVEVSLDPFARTVDSLEALELDDPVFLIGADEFVSFLSWKDPHRVLSLARLGVATRPGMEEEAIAEVLASLPEAGQVTVYPIAPHAISSTEIRDHVAAGEDVESEVGGLVAHEIARLGLYDRPGYAASQIARDGRSTLTSLEQARKAAVICEEKLATDVVLLDMRGVCDYTDYFVIATGQNVRQTKAIADEVHGILKKEEGLSPRSTTGLPEATWVVADYLDIVLHVFTPETREFYRLEELWNDVPKLTAVATG
jgi:ribosome silencing factor RsfS/YbeB/iojap/nicotinate (nicotinamide) nucleotide adenylyltransferase